MGSFMIRRNQIGLASTADMPEVHRHAGTYARDESAELLCDVEMWVLVGGHTGHDAGTRNRQVVVCLVKIRHSLTLLSEFPYQTKLDRLSKECSHPMAITVTDPLFS